MSFSYQGRVVDLAVSGGGDFRLVATSYITLFFMLI